jgi:hypothetical protein
MTTPWLGNTNVPEVTGWWGMVDYDMQCPVLGATAGLFIPGVKLVIPAPKMTATATALAPVPDMGISSVKMTGTASPFTPTPAMGIPAAGMTATGALKTPSITVEYLATGTGATGGGSTNESISWTDSIPADTQAALLAVSYLASTTATATATVGGTSMTSLEGPYLIYSASGIDQYLQVFGLLSPPTGSKTVQVSISGGTDYVVADVVYYFGVSGFGTAVENDGTGTSLSVAVASGQAGAAFCAMGTYTASSSGSTSISSFSANSRYNKSWTNAVNCPIQIGDSLAASSGVTFTASTNASAPWGAIAIPLL